MVEASSTDGDLTRSQDEPDDDLTTLKFVGPKTQSWLRRSLNIRTFRDLAALSVDQIHSRLQLDGRTVARDVIGQWIEQAANAVEASSKADQSAEVAKESGNGASEGNDQRSAASSHWKPFASFVLEFQAHDKLGERRTVAHHVEEDKYETWSGIESEKAGRWMVNSISDELEQGPDPEIRQQPQKKMPVEASPTPLPPASVEIIEVRLVHPPQSETPLYVRGEAYPGFVRSGQPFALEASFDLTGSGAPDTARSGARYRVRFYAHNLSTSEKTHLGDTSCDVTSEDQLSYSALLPNVTLAPGAYRLDCIAIFDGATARPGHCRVPIFQVA